MIRRVFLFCALAGCAAGGGPIVPRAPAQPGPVQGGTLRAPSDFASIADTKERSRALFVEAGKVLTHPRCTNCHPADDRPRQRNGEMHEPPVERGADGHGIPALECGSCHGERNAVATRVPGAHGWHLAPREMAWRDQSLASICAQLKDPARNGGRNTAAIVKHVTEEALVAWSWAPGVDREPAPGTQAQFVALVAAWSESGAECPPPEATAQSGSPGGPGDRR